MPELPEAETIRKGLNKTVKGKRIKEVTISIPNRVRRFSSKQDVVKIGRASCRERV